MYVDIVQGLPGPVNQLSPSSGTQRNNKNILKVLLFSKLTGEAEKGKFLYSCTPDFEENKGLLLDFLSDDPYKFFKNGIHYRKAETKFANHY